MMGVGKSTVGKNLAQKLSYNFVDIDRTIESREGSTINLIFKNKSESYFRKLENEISLEKLKKKNTVISLGGGAFLNKSIRREIKNTSVSFWLDVDVSEGLFTNPVQHVTGYESISPAGATATLTYVW